KGELLLTLSSERYDQAGSGAQEEISRRVQERLTLLEAERQKLLAVHKEEIISLDNVISNLRRTVDHYSRQIKLQQAHVALAGDSARRYRSLSSENYVSRDQ